MAEADHDWPRGVLPPAQQDLGDLDLNEDPEEGAQESEDPEGEHPQGPHRRARAGDGHKRPACTGAGCVFSTVTAGGACQVRQAGDKCVWCDPEKLQSALSRDAGKGQLRRALNKFGRMTSPALEAALAKLPADFQMTGKYCIAPDCIFSCAEVGKRMRTSGGKKYCLLCSFGPTGRLTAEKSGTGLETLRRCLSSYEASDPHVLEAAWARLSDDFKEGCEDFAALRHKRAAGQSAASRQAAAQLRMERAANEIPDDFYQKLKPLRPRLIALGLKIGDEPGDVLEAAGNNLKLQKPPWNCWHRGWFSEADHD